MYQVKNTFRHLILTLIPNPNLNPILIFSIFWGGNYTFSDGFNFYESSCDLPGLACTERTIVKRYGLKFEINVSGQAGQFSVMRCGLALGSGLAFLSIASLVTDFLLQHCWRGKQRYLELRNENLDEDLLFSSPSRSTSMHYSHLEEPNMPAA